MENDSAFRNLSRFVLHVEYDGVGPCGGSVVIQGDKL